ncbi:hypothetical protein KAW50_06150 [candidate division WOR-3 bacterium]|nr:hypothetical protein [candidate division WOR-3 bacterium]
MEISSIDTFDIYISSIEKQNEFIQKLTRAVVEQELANKKQELIEYLVDIYV